MNIYVGNMSFDTTEAQLRQAFESYGAVSAVSIITDKNTGEPRGFAFVEMATKAEAISAISNLNGQEMDGRTLKISEAKPREQSTGNRGGGSNYRKSY
jgi:RNA recognition motif-containing protein